MGMALDRQADQKWPFCKKPFWLFSSSISSGHPALDDNGMHTFDFKNMYLKSDHLILLHDMILSTSRVYVHSP